jgi:prepilin-type N-terminal cleavage/methylation domain-containing protein
MNQSRSTKRVQKNSDFHQNVISMRLRKQKSFQHHFDRTGIITPKGFTLLEMVVVLFIVSLFLTLTYPSFSYLTAHKEARSPHRLLSVIRLLHDSAINTREDLFIRFEFGGKKSTRPPQAVYTLPEGRRKLDLDGMVSVMIPSRGEIKEGKLTLIFGPFGYPEPFEVWFSGGDRVVYNPFSGRTVLERVDRS